MKKITLFIVLPFILILCTPLIFSIGLKSYIAFKTNQEFGNNVVYITDKSGAFSSSGSYRVLIWCTRDVKDLPINTIVTRAFLKYFDLDWNNRLDVLYPLHFGIVNDKNEVHLWSFKKMNYVNERELDSQYYDEVIYQAIKYAQELD